MAKLSEQEQNIFHSHIEEYISHPAVLKMKKYYSHGKITTYDHCFSVAKTAFWLNRRLKVGADEKTLLASSMLHDLYLYDWHTIGKANRHHATNHAELACRNAIRYFKVENNVQKCIRSHMWPICPTIVPNSKEAVLLTIADKCCSLRETLFCRF